MVSPEWFQVVKGGQVYINPTHLPTHEEMCSSLPPRVSILHLQTTAFLSWQPWAVEALHIIIMSCIIHLTLWSALLTETFYNTI